MKKLNSQYNRLNSVRKNLVDIVSALDHKRYNMSLEIWDEGKGMTDKEQKKYNEMVKQIIDIDTCIRNIDFAMSHLRIYRLRRGRDMLTSKQKKEFERLFNLYSRWTEFNPVFETEYHNKMLAFRKAVDILGYEFLPNGMKEEDGVRYQSYRLEKIENGEG